MTDNKHSHGQWIEAEARVSGVLRGGRSNGKAFVFHDGHGPRSIPLAQVTDYRELEVNHD